MRSYRQLVSAVQPAPGSLARGSVTRQAVTVQGHGRQVQDHHGAGSLGLALCLPLVGLAVVGLGIDGDVEAGRAATGLEAGQPGVRMG